MDMTLDEYLDEVDRWKQKAMEQTESLSAAAREKVLHDSLRWLERRIGRRLKVAGAPVREVNVQAAPRKRIRRRIKTRATPRKTASSRQR